MPVLLEHADVRVRVEELPGGRRSISVEPANGPVFIPAVYYETTYPVELIRLILRAKGPHLIDEIRREEDRGYVRKRLEADLFLHARPHEFRGKRLLDFGSGSGASTVVLARMLPETEIVGVELVGELVEVARARAEHYGLNRLTLTVAPDERTLPGGIGEFDFVVLSGVYEHLLPAERGPVLRQLWSVMKPGATLFINQTPNRHFPFELHTTGLPLINYLPDRVTLLAARRFSGRVAGDESWERLLRRGIRGATEGEIISHLPGGATLLRPAGLRDGVDVWYQLTADRARIIKRLLKLVLKGAYLLGGVALVPYHLNLAIRKEPHEALEETLRQR